MRRLALLVVALTLLFATAAAHAQAAAPVAHGAPAFDVKAAVDALLASVPAADRARSEAYAEGGYWLLLWDFLLGVALSLLLMITGLSRRMRDLCERLTRFKPVQTFLYWSQYLVVTTVISFPLAVYEGYYREKKYDLMNQTFGEWTFDQVKGLFLGLVLGGILVTLLFGIVRRLPRTWWLWGAIVTVAFSAVVQMIGPVYIAPMFNDYKKLEDPRVLEPILSMARANGIPANDVWQADESRQSKRVSANVSGFLGTMRITLNDNLLNRCSLDEIRSVMGHEMGHYVLNHVYKGMLLFLLVAFAFFAWLRWAVEWSLATWGAGWGVRDVGDTAVLPLVVLLASVFMFVIAPLMNSASRADEYEADMYGLNVAGAPDGEAHVDLMLGEYRKLDPSPLEEFLFFDHPSGRTRITAAMRWKAEHMPPEVR
jgi:STE24 endopeptidase